MMKLPVFDYRYYRIRADGQPFRRLYAYITQKDGLIESVELCDPAGEDDATTRYTCDIIAYVDTFQDGSTMLVVNYERTDHALLDLAMEYKSLTPVTMHDDGQYYFSRRVDQTHFQIACGR